MAANGRNASDQFAAHSMRPCRAQGAWRYPANRRRRPGRIILGCQQNSRCGLLHPPLPLVPHTPPPLLPNRLQALLPPRRLPHHATTRVPWLLLHGLRYFAAAFANSRCGRSALDRRHSSLITICSVNKWLSSRVDQRPSCAANSRARCQLPQVPYLACSRRALKRQAPPPAAEATRATSMT